MQHTAIRIVLGILSVVISQASASLPLAAQGSVATGTDRFAASASMT